jgi:alkylation response protein AidB-like acyl-CoA dehydrogenase
MYPLSGSCPLSEEEAMGALADEDQAVYRAWIRAGLDKIAPLRRTRVLAEAGRRDDPELWRELADLDVLGLAIPEAYGGSDVGGAAQAIFLVEAGRSLLPAPYLSTAFLTPWAIRCAGAQSSCATLLSQIAQGRARAALAVNKVGSTPRSVATRDGDAWRLTGHLPVVLEGDAADWLVIAAEVEGDPAVFLVDAHDSAVTVERLRSVDVTRPVAAITMSSAPAQMVAGGDAGASVIAEIQDLVRLALAADAVGGAQALLDMSVEHAKTRVQFARPIGQFQAIKHRCADLFVAVQAAGAAVEAAFGELEQLSRPRATTVSVASVCAQETYWQAVRTAMQIHGGLALTWEHNVHLYLKRATGSAHILGNPDRELARLTDAVLADGYNVVQEILG